MNIMVTGPRGGALPFERSYYVQEATEFFAKALDINRLKTNINVLMYDQLFINGDVMGYCEATTEREFTISLCSWGNWLSTLAHEMVHVRQFARGELDLMMESWKSRKYCGHIEYWNQPWEKEARRLQNKLVFDFMEQEALMEQEI